MPSREKIVEWLLQAGKDAEQTMPFADEPWKRMAAQVAAMRCETCKKDVVYTGIDEWVACPWNGSGGCFPHEPRA